MINLDSVLKYDLYMILKVHIFQENFSSIELLRYLHYFQNCFLNPASMYAQYVKGLGQIFPHLTRSSLLGDTHPHQTSRAGTKHSRLPWKSQSGVQIDPQKENHAVSVSHLLSPSPQLPLF